MRTQWNHQPRSTSCNRVQSRHAVNYSNLQSRRSFHVASSSTPGDQASTSGSSPPPAAPIPVPKAVSGLLKSLQDFGIGKNSLREGGVGLFLLGGCAAAFALVAWARSNAMRTGTPYLLTVELPLACGITIGTPLRIRGVQVGHNG